MKLGLIVLLATVYSSMPQGEGFPVIRALGVIMSTVFNLVLLTPAD
jgi:hypothetical protein